MKSRYKTLSIPEGTIYQTYGAGSILIPTHGESEANIFSKVYKFEVNNLKFINMY